MDVAEYEKSYALEDTCWWWVGRRELIPVLLGRPSGCEELVLDVGTGTGGNLSLLEVYGNVIGLDSSPGAVAYAATRARRHLVVGDAEELCFNRCSFDKVTALDVLEHVNEVRALRSIHSVLKPDGNLLLTVPAFQSLWSGHDVALGHRKRYRKAELVRVLETCGFRVNRISYWNTVLFFPVAGLRIVNRLFPRGTAHSDVRSLPGPVNGALVNLLRGEALLLRYVDFPVGVSLVCLARPCK